MLRLTFFFFFFSQLNDKFVAAFHGFIGYIFAKVSITAVTEQCIKSGWHLVAFL